MPINSMLNDRLEGIRAAIMAQHLGGKGFPNATKGNEREVFLREYLQKLFPAHNRFSSGVIIDSHNLGTGQIDIAVEHPFAPSFPMPASEDRLLLAESVAAVIEVKSDLSSQWDQACNTTEKVKPLRRSYGASVSFGNGPMENIPCIVVGYKGFTSVESMRDRFLRTPESRKPDAALVVESGVFFSAEGNYASGNLGLYMLCAYLNMYMRGLQGASVNLMAYLK